MVDSSKYLRDLSKNEIAELQTKFNLHMKRTKSGFLERPVKERLLHKKRWPEYTQDEDVYDFFYKIREHAKTALGDFMLLCNVLTENQLELIFGTKEQKLQSEGMYPITEVLSSLLPPMLSVDALKESINHLRSMIESAKIDQSNNKNRPDEVERLGDWIKYWEPKLSEQERDLQPQIEKLKEQEWRKFILEDLAIRVLQWYLASGIFRTDSHRRMIIDTMDAITIMSSDKKMRFRRDPDQTDMTNTAIF